MKERSNWPFVAKGLVGLAAVALVAVVWSMLASAVFLRCTGLLSNPHELPVTEWWLYWWHYGFRHPFSTGWPVQLTLGQWLQVAAAVATLLPTLTTIGFAQFIEEFKRVERESK